MLGEALRAQVSRLPETPKPRQLDTEMARLRAHHMRYEDLPSKQPQLRRIHQADGQPPTAERSSILSAQLCTQRELLNLLLQGGDTLILGLTKLRVSNSQLKDVLKEVNEATRRYLLQTLDVSPILLPWPVDIAQDLWHLISLDTLNQSGEASIAMLTSKETLLLLFAALALVGFSLSSRKHSIRFLERSSVQVGKVTQDHF